MRMRRRAEDRSLVVFQDLQPRGDIGGVILPQCRGQIEIGAEECAAQLCDQFLRGVACIAPALAPEVAVEAGLTARPPTAPEH
jgi:hypothetical protein